MSPDPQSGLSVLQALLIADDATTVKAILQCSPSPLDICIAILTTGTAAFLLSRMRSSTYPDQLAGSLSLDCDSPQPHRGPDYDITSTDAIIQLLNKMVKRFQNASLLREVASKGNLSQLFKVLSRSARFREDRKSFLERTDRHGTTLLMSACWSGEAEVVEFLLANGVRVQERDGKERTALHFAASNNSVDVVKLLLRAGAWMNDEDINGLIPLHCASKHGRTETTLFLIQNGCNVNRSIRLRYIFLPDLGNHLQGATALHLAAHNGHNDTVRALIQKGAKTNGLTSKGQTALMMAAEGGHMTTVQLLLSKGADINASDVSGNTALEFAALNDQLSVCKTLIDSGIDLRVFVGSDLCQRMLTSAVKRSNRGLLESLINVEDKVRVLLQDIRLSPWNKTLLHVAAETKGNVKVVDELAKVFPDVNVSTPREQTPLHFAADVSITRKLVEAGAKINAT